MDFLYQIIIYPIQLFIEIIYVTLYHALENFAGRSGYAIIGVSIAVSFLTLPMYIKAEKLQDIQRDILKKMEKKLESIKRNFTGDKKYMLISTYYRKNSYHPLMVLRSSLSLFIMIPFFMAAYIFLSEPRLLAGESFFFLTDLSKQDQLINLFDFKINLLPILMTIINIWASYVYTEKLSKSEKFQLYITAIVFLFLLYTSPSGLVFYWTCNNIFSLFKNIWMKYNFKIDFKINFISKIFEKLENLKLNTASCFILSMLLLWLISGILLPFNMASSSPIEFCGICGETSVWQVLSYPALQSFGIFVFWGILIFYLADKKLKNLFTILSLSTIILSIINIYRHSSSVISQSFRLLPAELTIPIPISYISIIIFYSIICFIFYKIFEKEKIKTVNAILSILLIACIINIFSGTYKINNGFTRYKKIIAEEKKSTIDKIFKFTKTGKNVLIVFLDKAINSFFPLALEQDKELKKSFAGFVYYPNTATFYCHTILGTPPIFGGYEYTPREMNKRKGIKMKDKHNESLLVLPSIFKKENAYVSFTDAPLKNYEWISDNKLFTEKGINAYNLMGTFTQDFLENKMDMNMPEFRPTGLLKHDFLLYSFMQISPDSINRKFYNSGKYLNSVYILVKQMIPGENIALFDSYSEFLSLKNISDYSLNNDLSLNIITNDLTHEPSLLQLPKYTIEKKIDNVGENYIGTEEAFKHYHVNASALYRLAEYFNELKKNGIYDNTRIIIVSDHGAPIKNYASELEIITYFNPLLIVKDFNSQGDYKIDNSLMTTADVPYIATKDLMNNPVNPFTGKSITEFDKSNGIDIFMGDKHNPQDFTGDNCIFEKYYFHIKNKVLDIKDWEPKEFKEEK